MLEIAHLFLLYLGPCETSEWMQFSVLRQTDETTELCQHLYVIFLTSITPSHQQGDLSVRGPDLG